METTWSSMPGFFYYGFYAERSQLRLRLVNMSFCKPILNL